MIDITKNKFSKYFLFGSLYISEGIEFSLATLIVTFYLADKGLPTELITAVAAAALIPWFLKFFWGGLTDYFIKFGRKTFIIIGGIVGAIFLFLLIFIDPAESIMLFTLFLVLSHVGVAFIDVSTDAWAIQTTAEEKRGKVNGAMYGGLFFGMAASAILLGVIASDYGYNAAFIVSGVLVLLLVIFPLFVKETKIIKKRQKIGSQLIYEFKKGTTQLVAILAPISSISGGIIYFVVPLYLKEVLHLSLTQTSILAAMFPIMMGVGSIIGGFITDNQGRKFALYLFFGGSAITFAALYFGTELMIFAIIYGLVGLMIGGYHAATCALIMDITNPKICATEYAALTSLFNVGEWAGGTLGGTLVVAFGYGRAFLYSGWFFGPALLILYIIKIKSNKKKR